MNGTARGGVERWKNLYGRHSPAERIDYLNGEMAKISSENARLGRLCAEAEVARASLLESSQKCARYEAIIARAAEQRRKDMRRIAELEAQCGAVTARAIARRDLTPVAEQ